MLLYTMGCVHLPAKAEQLPPPLARTKVIPKGKGKPKTVEKIKETTLAAEHPLQRRQLPTKNQKEAVWYLILVEPYDPLL